MKLLRGTVCVFLLALAVATLGFTQVITSTILGEVTDPSGAAVPGAEVVAKNADTGIAVRVTTSAAGTFSFPNLLAGNYEISVSGTGFQTAVAKNIILLSSTTLRQNVRLTMGQTSEAITVTGEAPLLQTASPTISGSLSERQIADLPIGIQSITGLMNLGPGAQTSWGANAPQTGGATHWGGTNFTVNGLTVNDFGNGNGGAALGLSLVNLPSVNSLQEFKTDSVNMSAEYRAVGSVSMVTKQGGNQFHGMAYAYNQNTALAANTFTLNRIGSKREKLNRNQFGANVGGPIVPNRAFFFFDYSGMRQRTVSQPQLNVPTQAMRNGDFSALYANKVQLFDPWSGNPFPNNQIPSSMFTPQAKALLAFYPLPNYLPGAANYVSGLPNNQGNYLGIVPVAKSLNTITFRGDYMISNSDSIYGVINRIVGDPWFEAQGTPANYGNYGNAGHKVTGASLSHVHVFSPSLINDFRVGWFDQSGARKGQNTDFDPRSIIPQLTPSPNRGLPGIGMSGYLGISDKNNSDFNPQYTIQFTENLTYTRGSHTFKFGFDETGYKNYVRQGIAPLGSFTFNGGWTAGKGWPTVTPSQGNAFADFLLGTASATGTGLVPPDQVAYSRDWEFYGQDTWQATSRLTLYYGLRYTYQSPWKLRDRTVTYFDPATHQLALPQDSATPTLPALASQALFSAYPFTTTQALGLPLDYIAGDKNNFAPRVGFAYRFLNATVIRGGYGIYYNFHPLFIGSRNDNNNPPWGGTSLGYSTKLPGKPTTPFLPDLTFAN
ncbi:MAG TPA: carboxypeptidase-like regulatory domain-containing protein, partial [Bryobacteraceae bacterium]|nr:carboxypeptidase-like regulatory domain-containing protein [Bryobacteraceae bacterium]